MAIETTGLVRSFRFEVNIEGIGTVGFNTVNGINDETDQTEYREGDENDVVNEYSGLISIGTVDMEKGIATSNQADIVELYRWRYAGSNTTGSIKINGQEVTSDGNPERRNVTVREKNEANEVVSQKRLIDCQCQALERSDNDAESTDIMIDTFTVNPEGLHINLEASDSTA